MIDIEFRTSKTRAQTCLTHPGARAALQILGTLDDGHDPDKCDVRKCGYYALDLIAATLDALLAKPPKKKSKST